MGTSLICLSARRNVTISITWSRTMSSTRPVVSASASATSPATNIICCISIFPFSACHSSNRIVLCISSPFPVPSSTMNDRGRNLEADVSIRRSSHNSTGLAKNFHAIKLSNFQLPWKNHKHPESDPLSHQLKRFLFKQTRIISDIILSL